MTDASQPVPLRSAAHLAPARALRAAAPLAALAYPGLVWCGPRLSPAFLALALAVPAIGLVAVHRLGDPVLFAVALLRPPRHPLEGLVVGDAEDPRRRPGTAVEARGSRPDGEHDVVEHLLDEVGAPRDPQQVSEQATVVEMIERLEGPTVLRRHLAQQSQLVVRWHANEYVPASRERVQAFGENLATSP
ncbi:MAG TPA: hypothetical protein VFS00_24695, partial [Polyangiaceae bacterium]|nr:hypothetical protein [Polyangiaceae bacterium]